MKPEGVIWMQKKRDYLDQASVQSYPSVVIVRTRKGKLQGMNKLVGMKQSSYMRIRKPAQIEMRNFISE